MCFCRLLRQIHITFSTIISLSDSECLFLVVLSEEENLKVALVFSSFSLFLTKTCSFEFLAPLLKLKLRASCWVEDVLEMQEFQPAFHSAREGIESMLEFLLAQRFAALQLWGSRKWEKRGHFVLKAYSLDIMPLFEIHGLFSRHLWASSLLPSPSLSIATTEVDVST